MPPPAPAPAPAAGTSSRIPAGALALIAVLVVVAVIGVGVGAYVLTKSDAGPEASADESPTGSGGEVEPSDPSTDLTSVVPEGGEVATPPVDQTAGVTPSGDFEDDAHRVRFSVPGELTLVQPFDGTRAEWQAGDLTFEYEVLAGGTVADADARYQELLGSLETVTYDNDTAEGRTDGRYIVSGYYLDGGAIYERGKVRCGDLVSYRLTWVSTDSMPLVEQLTDSLVNDQPELDSMGGDHPSC